MTKFTGFSPAALQFLADLAANNEREWFLANKATFDAELMEPAKAFVEAMGLRFEAFAPEVRAEPRVNGSIFRINRDTRFSRDKTPYKTHLDLWFWSGDKKGWDCSGFFFRMHPTSLILGAGIHKFEKPLLAAYRDAVVDDKRGGALTAALANAQKLGAVTVGGEHYKKVPKGYEAEGPRADLLRHNGLTAAVEVPMPKGVHTARFVDFCARRFEGLSPVHRWLMDVTKTAK